jgi:hypothetical protein
MFNLLIYNMKYDIHPGHQDASVKAYRLTDFKEFAFLANRCFVWMWENRKGIPNVFVMK